MEKSGLVQPQRCLNILRRLSAQIDHLILMRISLAVYLVSRASQALVYLMESGDSSEISAAGQREREM